MTTPAPPKPAARALPPQTEIVSQLPATVPFVGPETQERARGRPFAARLGANESGFGPSPRAVAAMADAAAQAWKYGDPEAFALRSALAARLGTPLDALCLGEGIDGLLGGACRLFVTRDTPVVTSLGAYPTFNYHVAGLGGRLIKVPYRSDREDLDGLLAAARTERARVVYLSNPDNPMGSWWTGAEVDAFARALPEDCVLLLDEAYLETAPEEAGAPLDLDRPNLLRFRTFSKAMGLAGLRVGYVVGAPEMVRAFDKIRNHFGVGRVAQAGALAALADTAWLSETVARIERARARLAAIATANGLAPLPSAANFVAMDCGRDGAFARTVLEEVIARDVFIRMPGVAPLDRCIRVSVGPDAELDDFEAALPEALRAAAAR